MSPQPPPYRTPQPPTVPPPGVDVRAAAPALRVAAVAASHAASALPEPAATIARVTAAALAFAADLAAQGTEPVRHITRIHAAEPLLAEVEGDWRAELARRWPEGNPRVPSPPREPDDDDGGDPEPR